MKLENLMLHLRHNHARLHDSDPLPCCNQPQERFLHEGTHESIVMCDNCNHVFVVDHLPTVKFRVVVTAEVSASATLTVNAATEEEAWQNALDAARELDFEDWDLGQLGRIEGDHAELIAEDEE